MFIPLRTDRAPKKPPLVTGALIVINMVVYLAGLAGFSFGAFEDASVIAARGHFDPGDFEWWRLLTYQFIHADIWHLAFNMLFLWVFGCAVEGRFGRVGFAGFYLVGGAVSGLAHAMVAQNPVIGASGSIAGVTGAFLALFPRSRIQVLVFFFMIGVVSVPSLWFIGFYFALDVINQFFGGGRVAYMAHIAGYLYGFGTGFCLLATGILKHEEFDVFYLFRQARRRAAFRAASRAGPAGMWDTAQADTDKRLRKQANTRDTGNDELSVRLSLTKSQVTGLLARGDLAGAARAYRRVLAEAPEATASVLGERQQLDVASQLYALGEYTDAARAYELLLARYPASPRRDEVRLMLGLIYARRLDQPERARALISAAREGLRDEAQVELADQLLADLGT
jgi:membrane associated rhomboid family serine protease